MAGPLVDKVNERFAGVTATDEPHVIGEDVANEVFLDEAPEPGTSIVVVDPAGPTTYTRIAAGAPAATEYRVEEEWGRLIFNSADNGTALEIDYTAIGSKYLARDINRIQARLKGEVDAPGGVYVKEITKTAGSITLDPKTEVAVFVSGTANTTLENFASPVAGQSGYVAFVEDGTGGRTLSFGTNWVQVGSGSVNTAANKRNLISWIVRGTEIWYTIVPEA